MEIPFEIVTILIFGSLWGLLHAVVWTAFYSIYYAITAWRYPALYKRTRAVFLIIPTFITIPADYYLIQHYFSNPDQPIHTLPMFQTWAIILGLWLYLLFVFDAVEK